MPVVYMPVVYMPVVYMAVTNFKRCLFESKLN